MNPSGWVRSCGKRRAGNRQAKRYRVNTRLIKQSHKPAVAKQIKRKIIFVTFQYIIVRYSFKKSHSEKKIEKVETFETSLADSHSWNFLELVDCFVNLDYTNAGCVRWGFKFLDWLGKKAVNADLIILFKKIVKNSYASVILIDRVVPHTYTRAVKWPIVTQLYLIILYVPASCRETR